MQRVNFVNRSSLAQSARTISVECKNVEGVLLKGINAIIKHITTQTTPAQRIVIAVIVPIVVILLGWGLMSFIDSHDSGQLSNSDYDWGWSFDPTDLNDSWWGWLLVFTAIGIFEYLWLPTISKKNDSEEK
ncbi:hypothetical protein ACFL6U_22665 [Planctomycetota bacterium]